MRRGVRAAAPRPLGWFDIVTDACAGAIDAAMLPVSSLALAQVPRGAGHAVLVLPGFLSGDHPTWLLRWFLAQIGYRAYPWELGFNVGMSSARPYDLEALLEHRLKEVLLESSDHKVSVIGWSLGGVYAKALARRFPRLIRDVITLGSPISGDNARIRISRLYERMNQLAFADPEIARQMREANRPLTGVPITACYCRNDGVVPWRNAREAPGPLVQNVEVDASHVGMGFDAFVFYLIAHRFAQSALKRWTPLDLDRLRATFRQQRWSPWKH